jgi:catechol 2,3-dioxygenase-like lactoylglutathione lyase family enzyme
MEPESKLRIRVMSVIHHSAVCVSDMDASLRFWRDGLGFEVLMDHRFEGDWPALFGAPSESLRAVFLGDPDTPGSGIVELLDLGDVGPGRPPESPASNGLVLLSVFTDLAAVLHRLSVLGSGGVPRRIDVSGVAMAVVSDPDGVLVELVDSGAAGNLERLSGSSSCPR